MNSIKFDGTEIRDTTYIPRFVKHESAPDREITSLPLAREDGEVLICEKYGMKVITVQGILTGSTQADLETKIDSFKELFSRPEKNLDLEWISGTRRYVATCRRHEFDRDHFHLLFVPWTAEFVALSGEGKDTSETTILNEHVVLTTTPGADSFAMAGSKPAKATITIKGANFDNTQKGIEYKNTDTGEKIVVTRNKTWNTTASIIIDCLLKKVTDNIASSVYTEGIFYGVFPKFKIGTNGVQITVGGLVNQKSSDDDVSTDLLSSSDNINSTDIRKAQSFSVPYSDETFQGIILALDKTGSPGNITVNIETDNGNKPSGSLVSPGATITIAAADVGASVAYITKYAAAVFSLDANTKYWIVVSAAGVDVSNYYTIYFAATADYTRGKAMYSTDAGSTYSDYSPERDLSFRVLYGGKSATSSIKHTVKYTATYL